MLVSQGSLVCNWIIANLIPQGWMYFNISITQMLVYNPLFLQSLGGGGWAWGEWKQKQIIHSSDLLSFSWSWGPHPKDWKLGQVTLLWCRPISDFQTTRKKMRPKASDKWFSEMNPKILARFTKNQRMFTMVLSPAWRRGSNSITASSRHIIFAH